MDDREKEGEVEERVEVPELPEERVERREEEEIEEGPAIGEAVAEEEERCEDDPDSSVLRERSQSIISSTPVSTTDSKILEHFEQMRTFISGFLQQKSDKQPFFDYVASEAKKMTQEEFEELKGKIFRDIESIKTNRRRQQLPRRSATITTELQRVGILPTTTQQASSSTQAAAGSSFVYYTPSPIGFSNPTSVQDEGSRHNLSGILSQLPDLTSTQIVEQPQPQQPQQQQQQLFTITTSALPQQQQQPPQ